MREVERRERVAQRDAVAQVLPEPGEGSVLRTTSGEVLVFDEGLDKRNPVNLRAIVLPDGETVEVETNRFRRLQ
jgi:hypothetical protein